MHETLLRRSHRLSSPERQRELLAQVPVCAPFEARLESAGLWPLRATGIETLQINVGRRCNQVCAHCHVDAGPDRPELMDDRVVDACLALVGRERIPTLDITGGAPELHPRFREIVREAHERGAHVIHRCNLTAIQLPAYRDVPELLARCGVEIIASLPALDPTDTDLQRGVGVFEASIEGIRRLNELGYGDGSSGLRLNLASNPIGATLPSAQSDLECAWKSTLAERFGVRFDRLLLMANLPVSRFLEDLDRNGDLEGYMGKLTAAFNPRAAEGVMCRSTLSVGYDGRLFDCDFNQMLEVAVTGSPNVLDLDSEDLRRLDERAIAVGPHCFGCTAGAGSSCGGAITTEADPSPES